MLIGFRSYAKWVFFYWLACDVILYPFLSDLFEIEILIWFHWCDISIFEFTTIIKATDRAHHPSEVQREKLQIDLNYYFKNQLIPVITRLLDPIEGTDEQLIAKCFGLDPKEFKSKSAERAKQEREAEQVNLN